MTSAFPLPGLSILLPCFNEVDNVREAIVQARSAAQRVAARHEIVVVDDGSTDGTGAIARAVAARFTGVRVVTHEQNGGYGAALRTGIQAARMPWMLLTDADLQFDLRQLDRVASLAYDRELIVGRRVHRQDPLHRRMNALAWNWLVRTVFDVPVHDVDCAFKLARTDLLKQLELHSTGATISTELIVKGMAHGARVLEVDVEHRPRAAGRQSGARPQVVLRALRELIELRGRPLRVAG